MQLQKEEENTKLDFPELSSCPAQKVSFDLSSPGFRFRMRAEGEKETKKKGKTFFIPSFSQNANTE